MSSGILGEFPSNLPRIIGLGGLARAGKDTVADYLAAKHGYSKVAFAYPLKAAAREIFGLSSAQLYGDQKETTDEFWGVTPRTILQKLGTECLRDGYAQDVWVRALERRIIGEGRYVISDARFLNEVKAVKSWGGVNFQIVRPGNVGAQGGVAGHSSENALNGYKWDATITNDSSLDNLYDATRAALGVCS